MSIKSNILLKAGLYKQSMKQDRIDEAAEHLNNQVLDLIRNDKFEEAAKLYAKNMKQPTDKDLNIAMYKAANGLGLVVGVSRDKRTRKTERGRNFFDKIQKFKVPPSKMFAFVDKVFDLGEKAKQAVLGFGKRKRVKQGVTTGRTKEGKIIKIIQKTSQGAREIDLRMKLAGFRVATALRNLIKRALDKKNIKAFLETIPEILSWVESGKLKLDEKIVNEFKKYKKKAEQGGTFNPQDATILLSLLKSAYNAAGQIKAEGKSSELEKSKEELDKIESDDKTKLQQIAKEVADDWIKSEMIKVISGSSRSKNRKVEADDEVGQILLNFADRGELPPDITHKGKKWSGIQQIQKILKVTNEEGLKNIEVLYNTMMKPSLEYKKDEKYRKELEKKYDGIQKKLQKEHFIIKQKMLKESYGYKGIFFKENYLMSNILKAFAKDLKKYGEETTKKTYTMIFGEETEPIFENLIENEYYATIVAEIKDEFLFESIGKKNIEKHLKKMQLNEQTNLISIVHWLSKVWKGVKNWGAGIGKKIMGFVEANIPWASKIAKQGATFFATNPVGQVVLPAVLITGGVVAGYKLLKWVFKKFKKKKLEKEEYKKLISKKLPEIEKLADQGVEGADKIEKEVESLEKLKQKKGITVTYF
jgi:hypothetical protein